MSIPPTVPALKYQLRTCNNYEFFEQSAMFIPDKKLEINSSGKAYRQPEIHSAARVEDAISNFRENWIQTHPTEPFDAPSISYKNAFQECVQNAKKTALKPVLLSLDEVNELDALVAERERDNVTYVRIQEIDTRIYIIADKLFPYCDERPHKVG